MSLNTYWAYLHSNGKVILKRFLSPADFADADESPFVVRRTPVFEAPDHDHALAIAKKILRPKE